MDNIFDQSHLAATFGGRKPNFLLIMVDEERYPVIYETDKVRAWRQENLRAYEFLKHHGLEFKAHYAGSVACVPSRATLYTGQYPSLHGVSQTVGAAKSAYDPDVFWLDPNTVPTMGDYFRAAGYQTYWKGKWHASAENILIPGTHNAFLSYNPDNGVPVPEAECLYLKANNLRDYGFDGWVGPEPHGSSPRDSGSSAATGISGRDVAYKQQTVELIKTLDQRSATKGKHQQKPWLIVCSFVNPHDIAIFGAFTQASASFSFKVDPSVPLIPPAPTASECLSTKPTAQLSYKRIYQLAFQPLLDTQFYRQLYYSLQLQVDREISDVLDALKNSSFYDNTIVIFTSDHGDLLGSHGGLFQKWYQAYEEAIHVPLIIHNRRLFPKPQSTEMLTSHVDVVPTMLGLAGINTDRVQEIMKKDHTEVHPFVGRNLAPLLYGKECIPRANEPIYFMTDDNVTKGLNQVSATGIPYPAVRQPNSVETVITTLPTGDCGSNEVWKYSRYFDNPQFDTIQGRTEQFAYRGRVNITFNPGCHSDEHGNKPVPDEFEMYNLTTDPLEINNLADGTNQTPVTAKIQLILHQILKDQRTKKRLSPTSGNISLLSKTAGE